MLLLLMCTNSLIYMVPSGPISTNKWTAYQLSCNIAISVLTSVCLACSYDDVLAAGEALLAAQLTAFEPDDPVSLRLHATAAKGLGDLLKSKGLLHSGKSSEGLVKTMRPVVATWLCLTALVDRADLTRPNVEAMGVSCGLYALMVRSDALEGKGLHAVI